MKDAWNFMSMRVGGVYCGKKRVYWTLWIDGDGGARSFGQWITKGNYILGSSALDMPVSAGWFISLPS